MQLYHVFNRGVEKRDIFQDSGDRVRFVHGMYVFNSTLSSENADRSFDETMNDIVSRSSERGRERLVDIHGWCLMNNHYHLLLSERQDKGITQFVRRLNIGHAKFFNEKYKRSGYLFQGRTKKVPIVNDSHLAHILHYIHLNPLDMLTGAADWRERAIKSHKSASEYLLEYRWSSLLDYCGKHNFPSILTKNFFGDYFRTDYKTAFLKYLKQIEVDKVSKQWLE